MTDITELAQRMKAAAEKAGIEQWVNNRGEVNTADYEVDGGVYIDHICDCEIIGTESPQAEFIAMANPANILSLVEALEKAQADGSEYAASERAEAVKNVALQDEIYGLKSRIAELESRSVKLPSELELRNNEVCSVCAGNALQVIEDKLTAAGITLLHTTNKEEIPMQEKINELSVVIANFLHEEDPEEFCEENSGNRAELLADKLAEFLVNNGHA